MGLRDMSMKPQKLSRKSSEEVLAWIEQFQKEKSEEIQTKLVIYYTPLVKSIARKFSHGQDFEEDFVQVGMVALLQALARFDTKIGQSFESFAIPTIIGEIKRFIRDKTWSIHVPRRIKELGPKINQAVDELTTKLQRSPKIDEIAQFLKVSSEEVLEAMEMSKSYYALSVDRQLDDHSDGTPLTLLDFIGYRDGNFEKKEQELLLEKAFSILTDREREIIISIYYKNLSQKEVGARLGISQMHVSRLQRRAIEKLRNFLQAKKQKSM